MKALKIFCLQTGKILNCLRFLTLLFVFGFSQNAHEIIAKIETNQSKIIDLEAEVEIETSIQGQAEPMMQTMKIWQAKDEKENTITRTEFMLQDNNRNQTPEKVIMVMTEDSVCVKKGNNVSRLPLKLAANTKGKIPDINVDIFENAKSVKVLRQEGNNTVIEVIPEEMGDVKIFNKAEITVDTEKGIITSQKLFTPMGVIKSEMEYERHGETEKGGNGVWVLKQIKTITQYGVTTMRYKNVKVNKGINKEMFKL